MVRTMCIRLLVSFALMSFFLHAQGSGELVELGMKQFVGGKIAESVQSFDKAAAADASVAPHLWQRGISYYYLGRFEEGRKQFETHRTVNPDDVENAAWWYICMSRLGRRKEAEAKLLPVGSDPRVPMMEVYALFAGKASIKDVEKAMEAGSVNEQERKNRRFYGHLYLGLYEETAGNLGKAKSHLQDAFDQRVGGYMWEVTRIHLAQLGKK